MKLYNTLFCTALISVPVHAETWGSFAAFGHVKSNDSQYVDLATEQPTRFGFDLELNTRFIVDPLILTVGAEGDGKPTPGFTKVAGILKLTYELTPTFEVFAYHRSAHNLDRPTNFKRYGFSNDNQIGLKMYFRAR